ncbi:hypothetical protein Dsui_0190 [Azospira oryzae PS]|uniref:Uncharacterized protein n=1 Tax=Azospira oryzae (strain ATCC BAA-33 / DSM 13638 / PS) TaxID=640081 RepID=G8QMN0_AZOOP|nr:hypothetical protein [Azospira oryzae]AEV24610.1 hypothetical protein Dsui_0190 [Azospira oryzae PS]
MSAPQPPRCTLARLIAEPMNKDAVKRDGWQQHKILVVALDDDRLGMIDREFVRQIGERLYGPKRHR